MSLIKFAVWNAEWLNELFTGNPPVIKPLEEKGYKTGHKTGDRIKDLAGVFNAINADVWVIVEGPNQSEELQLLFDHPQINGNWHCAVQPSGAQSLGLAVRTDTGKFEANPFTHFEIKTHDEAKILLAATNEFRMDTDGDSIEEIHKFERRPLYAEINMENGQKFRVLGLHLKSKGIFDALEWSQWWSKADGNRKKIVAQCHQLRVNFLDNYLLDPATQNIPFIVCGDINDGPGFDTSEMKISASGVEKLMGNIWNPSLCLGNAIFDQLNEKKKLDLNFSELYTASFADPIFNSTYRRSWIDHILYSLPHKGWVKNAKIHHTVEDDVPIYRAFPKSSDHRPLSCEIELN